MSVFVQTLNGVEKMEFDEEAYKYIHHYYTLILVILFLWKKVRDVLPLIFIELYH